MNLLNLFEDNSKRFSQPLYIYSGWTAKTQDHLDTISRIYSDQAVTVLILKELKSLETPANFKIKVLDLSDPLLPSISEAFNKVIEQGQFKSILIQNDDSPQSCEVVDLLPLLAPHADTRAVAFINANFQIIPINELIEIWKNPIYLRDASFTVDCPGLMIERELAHLERLARTRPESSTVVEIGRYYGRSTIALGQGVKNTNQGKLVSIDPFVAPGIEDRIKSHCVSKYVELWNQTSEEGFKRWKREHPDHTIGLLFIDGDHRYDSVVQDIHLWSQFLQPGGFIALHDYYETQPGCLKALNERILWSGNFEHIELKTSLLIARKKNESGNPL